MVRIPRFHRGGRGSIPRFGEFLFFVELFFLRYALGAFAFRDC